MADRQEEILDGVHNLHGNLRMRCSKLRRPLSLESLEYRITPTGLGLTLPTLALALPTPGHSGVGLGVNVGLLSLNAGLGSREGLLSLEAKLDLPLVPPVALQTSVGSSEGLLALGVQVEPPAPPAGSIPDPGSTLPPIDLPIGMPPIAPPVVPPILPPADPAPATSSQPGAPAASVVPMLPVIAFRSSTVTDDVATASAPILDELLPEPTAVAGSDTPTTNLRPVNVKDLAFESFATTRKPDEPSTSPRGDVSDEEQLEEIFRLREAELLEDFGMVMDSEADVATEARSSAPIQGESDSETALWLVSILAGCVAGSSWLNRREKEASAPVDADPSLFPVG